MTQFKINKNKSLPDEAIYKHKDFGKLMSNHQKITTFKEATKPLYKNPGFMSFIIIVSVVILTFVITENDKKSTNEKKDTISSAQPSVDTTSNIEAPLKPSNDSLIDLPAAAPSKVSSPASFKNPEILSTCYTIDAQQGASIYHKSTRILIPALAFQDAQGRAITGEVQLTYREFIDPVDTYLAGIPMHSNISGKEIQLESAAMFEIRGFTGNKPVYLKKPLTVELAATEHVNKYNTYYLNEKTKKWELKGKEEQFMRFMIDANEKEYPELSPLKELVWEFAVNDQQKDPSQYRTIFSKVWSSFSVSEAAMLNTKDVKIKQNSSESKFLAHPIALINNEDANKRLMQAKFDEYYSLLKTKEKIVRDVEEAKRRQQEWLNSPQGKAYLTWAKSEYGQKQILSSRVVNVFKVNQFGIWNCNTPVNIVNSTSVSAAFMDQNGNKLKPDQVYLVDYSINSVFIQSTKQVTFNPASKNILWTALLQGKLAIAKSDQFRAIKGSSATHTFKMEIVDINGKDINEVKEFLGMKEHITAKAIEKDNHPVATYKRVIQLRKPLRENDSFYKSDVSEIDEGYKMNTTKDEVNTEVNKAKKEAEEKAKAEAEKAKQDALNKGTDLLKKKW